MGDVNFDLMGRERAQVSEDSALFVSNWSLDHSERYRELRRKIRAAIAAVAVLDGPLTEELLEILTEMEQQEPPLPDDLRDLQRAARVALTWMPEEKRPDVRPQLREFLAWYEEVLGRVESGAVVAPGEQERLTEEASAVAHLLDLLDSSADEPAS